ncbi:hypothetical protein HAX54_042212 [Datura stramonium]|uniref:Cytochrome P450 n=1 Tax=Datura stramonium TaxID=4076 RepID=A0ABS8SMA1_DATST|nr:hypothetical protein [Datura stramonium]
MKKLQKELQEVVGLERMVEESDLENLNYLDMVVKEGLRFHPVVPQFYHESMEDCPEPEKFFSERFIESNIDFPRRDFQLLPFSSGRRSCPEMHLGVMVVRLVEAQLVHCFEWEIPNAMVEDKSVRRNHQEEGMESKTAFIEEKLNFSTEKMTN